MSAPMATRPQFAGQRIKRLEDPRFLTGHGQYVADIQLSGTVHVAFVRSNYAHARIKGIKVEEARKDPRCFAVLTGAELAQAKVFLPGAQNAPLPALAIDEVCYVGQPICAVVAPDRYVAEDLAETIEVAYEPLPAIVDTLAATQSDAPKANLAFPTPGNVFFHMEHATDGIDDLFADPQVVVVRQTFRTQRQTGMPMETRGIVASWEPGTAALTVYAATQMPHGLRDTLAAALHLSQSKVRVISPDVGGGFGMKAPVYPEDVVVSFLAQQLGRPVKWISDRREGILADTHARDGLHIAEAAFSKDGLFLGLRDHMISPAGAYPLGLSGAVAETMLATLVLPGPYKVQQYAWQIDGVLTNTTPTGTYRGVWGPAATWVQEGMIERAARQLGIDRVEIRLKNMVRKEEFPYHSVAGVVYDPGSYQESLQLAMEKIGYAGFEEERRQAAAQGRSLGLGIACFIEPTAMGVMGDEPLMVPHDVASIRIEPSGQVIAQVGISSHGQGHETTVAQLIADQLGIDVQNVTVLHGDTAAVPYGGGTGGSRSITIGGGAAILAAQELRQKVLQIAGQLLEAAPEDLEIADGTIQVKGVPGRTVTLAQVAQTAYMLPQKLPQGMEPGLEATKRYAPPPITFSNGCHAAVVEVDQATGAVKVLRYVVVEDCGKMVNPMIVEGQITGGVAQGVGSAFLEQLVYDENGQLMTTTWMDYLMPESTDAPKVDFGHIETPSQNPGGMKGMGESSLIASPTALVSAVEDALGVWVGELPLTPQRVLALAEGRQEAAGA